MAKNNSIVDSAVLVSTYNWPEVLTLSVRSIFQQTILPREIVIADDGSKDPTREAIEKLKLECPDGVTIKHVWHEDRGFRAAAIRNKALAQVESPYLIQIDGDCIMERHFIQDHLAVAREGYFIAGSRVNLPKEYSEVLLSTTSFSTNLISVPFSHKLNSLRVPLLRDFLASRYHINNLWWVRGANMSFFMKDIRMVNGYNESFEGWGHEDNELSFRLLNSGVHKRALKFGGVLYHVCHEERSRANVEHLRNLAYEVYVKGIKRTENGLDNCQTRR
ncbi:glycosyltransferase family 2 protein [Falsiporphyromonas endometrii]|uniref:Glycosyltransferase family 2 protein n=1 Tax=Falsiporphyromonas endometrii TaxID=1387297 RepID=A0ABV9KA23_9PORP